MNPITRLWRYLKALMSGKLDQWEDPEIILNEAVKEMKENQGKNRELAIQAITQRNNLQSEVDKSTRLVAELEKKAMVALQGGNRELAKQFLKEKALHDQTLETMRSNIGSANETVENVKQAIRCEEERVRVKTAEAMVAKTSLKQAQIQNKIQKAMDQFNFSDNEGNWASATERIRTMQSEASARSEMASTSIDGKMRDLEVSQMDVEADRQLAELEQKMRLSTSPAANYTTTQQPQMQTVGAGVAPLAAQQPESDLDRQLKELETRLGGSK